MNMDQILELELRNHEYKIQAELDNARYENEQSLIAAGISIINMRTEQIIMAMFNINTPNGQNND